MRSTPSTPDQQAVAPFASAVTRPSRRDSPPPGLTAARTHRRLVPPPPYASLLRHERADANCALDASCTVPSRQIRRLARKSWRTRAGHRHEPEAKTTGSASPPAPADNAEARSPGSEPPESRAPKRSAREAAFTRHGRSNARHDSRMSRLLGSQSCGGGSPTRFAHSTKSKSFQAAGMDPWRANRVTRATFPTPLRRPGTSGRPRAMAPAGCRRWARGGGAGPICQRWAAGPGLRVRRQGPNSGPDARTRLGDRRRARGRMPDVGHEMPATMAR